MTWRRLPSCSRIDLRPTGRVDHADVLLDADVLRRCAVACRARRCTTASPGSGSPGHQTAPKVDHSRILYSTDKSGGRPLSAAAPCSTIYVLRWPQPVDSNIDRFPNPNNLDHVAHLISAQCASSPMAIVAEPTRSRTAAPIGFRSPRRTIGVFEPALRNAVDAGTVHLDVIADELRPELPGRHDSLNRCESTIPIIIPN